MSNPNIKYSKVVIPQKAQHGTGFMAYRLSDSAFSGLLNPVLNVDHYFMSEPTFPPHPHAGFSAITYMFEDSATSILNRDTLGNEININPGDLHWAQAGKGMMHEEPPLVHGLVSHGLQIFINLPKKLKDSDPKVYHIANAQAPRVMSENGIAEVKVAAGNFGEASSPMQVDWPTDLLQLKWKKDGGAKITLRPGQSALVLNMSDTVTLSDTGFSSVPKYAGVAVANKGSITEDFEIFGNVSSDVVIIRGQVIDEPAIFHGPFVATDVDEMNKTINRYRRGEFGELLPREDK
ncbi:pirin family protein [Bdellovibrio sp. HCB290]|uniref:pirin family protein n=1 Tax=Bdellovibrio sp. HCB290 TaxID=3394356 RepID=UPI0039B69CC0